MRTERWNRSCLGAGAIGGQGRHKESVKEDECGGNTVYSGMKMDNETCWKYSKKWGKGEE
jgi:hypothetical protein